MNVHRLESVDAGIAFDLDDAPVALCATRQGRKVDPALVVLLARTTTYQMASFGRKIGGAAVGINAKPDDRARTVGAFVTEVSPLVAKGELFVNPGPGVSLESLRPLRKVDDRNPLFWSDGARLRGIGAAAAAEIVLGGLEGRRVVIEGFDAAGEALIQAVAQRGGKIVAVSSVKGTVVAPEGLSLQAMLDAHEFHGATFVKELGREVGPPAQAFDVEADVLVTGSDIGIIDDEVAARLAVRAVVPSGPVPLTRAAFDGLRGAGVIVVPDFVSTAGPLFAMWPEDDATLDAVEAAAARAIGEVIAEVLDDPEGPFLAACTRAETFLRTWQHALPDGRPLA